jgi:hypothetical protein
MNPDGIPLRDTLFGANPSPITEGPLRLISTILPNLYVIAGLLLLLYLLFAGVLVVFTAGSAEQTQQGRQAITNAIIGFLLIFTSYWIIQTIQYMTGIPILGGGDN